MPSVVLTLFQTVLRKLTPAEVDANFTNLGTAVDAATAAASTATATANTANTTANAASATANTANTTANTALTTANQALAAAGTPESGPLNPVAAGISSAGVGTYSKQVGKYSLDSNGWVEFTLTIGWTAHTGTGSLKITGLPYVSDSTSSLYSAVSVYYESLLAGSGRQFSALVIPGSAVINLYDCDPAGATGVPSQAMDTTVNQITLTGRYKKA